MPKKIKKPTAHSNVCASYWGSKTPSGHGSTNKKFRNTLTSKDIAYDSPVGRMIGSACDAYGIDPDFGHSKCEEFSIRARAKGDKGRSVTKIINPFTNRGIFRHAQVFQTIQNACTHNATKSGLAVRPKTKGRPVVPKSVLDTTGMSNLAAVSVAIAVDDVRKGPNDIENTKPSTLVTSVPNTEAGRVKSGIVDTDPAPSGSNYRHILVGDDNYMSLMPVISPVGMNTLANIESALRSDGNTPPTRVIIGDSGEVAILSELACGESACAFLCKRNDQKGVSVAKIGKRPIGMYNPSNHKVKVSTETNKSMNEFAREFVMFNQLKALGTGHNPAIESHGTSAIYMPDGSNHDYAHNILPVLYFEKMDMSLDNFLPHAMHLKGDPVVAFVFHVTFMVKALVCLKTLHLAGILHIDPHDGNFLLKNVKLNGQGVDPTVAVLKIADLGYACRFEHFPNGKTAFSCFTKDDSTLSKRYEHPFMWEALQFFWGCVLTGLEPYFKQMSRGNLPMGFPAAFEQQICERFYQTLRNYEHLRSMLLQGQDTNEFVRGSGNWTYAQAALEGELFLRDIIHHLVRKVQPKLALYLLNILKRFAANTNIF